MKKILLFTLLISVHMKASAQYVCDNIPVIDSRNIMDFSLGPINDTRQDTLINYGKDYDLYKYRRNAATGLMTVGIILTAAGFGVMMARMAEVSENWNPDYDFPTGFLLFGIGMPITISTAIMSANNRHAMRAIERSTNLSLNITRYGIGLCLQF